MKPLICLLVCLLAAAAPLATPAAAAPAEQALVEESELNRHVHAIADQLRCLVCQGQTVADSNSGLAADMRAKIREQLKQGWNDQRIRAYFVARYGDFVLYRPPVEASTWALWFGPLIMLLLALAVLLTYLHRRARLDVPAALTPADTRRARLLLHPHKEDEP